MARGVRKQEEEQIAEAPSVKSRTSSSAAYLPPFVAYRGPGSSFPEPGSYKSPHASSSQVRTSLALWSHFQDADPQEQRPSQEHVKTPLDRSRIFDVELGKPPRPPIGKANEVLWPDFQKRVMTASQHLAHKFSHTHHRTNYLRRPPVHPTWDVGHQNKRALVQHRIRIRVSSILTSRIDRYPSKSIQLLSPLPPLSPAMMTCHFDRSPSRSLILARS